jgi:hypothetical protein
MKPIENFTYNDIVLYAKGWYEKTDLYEDLGYLLSKIYGWTPKRDDELAYFMLDILERIYEAQDKKFSSGYLCSFASFWTEANRYADIYECTYNRAIILLVLGRLQGLTKNEIKLNPPHYGKKEHFRMGCLIGKNPISMTYTEMNRRAQQMFK